jgi:hypothetical protein
VIFAGLEAGIGDLEGLSRPRQPVLARLGALPHP